MQHTNEIFSFGRVGPMGEHLAGSQKLGISNLWVKELEKALSALTIIPCFQDAAAALVGRKQLLQNILAAFLQGIRTSSLKMGLICFFHAEKMTFDTDRTIWKKHSERNPLLPSFP